MPTDTLTPAVVVPSRVSAVPSGDHRKAVMLGASAPLALLWWAANLFSH